MRRNKGIKIIVISTVAFILIVSVLSILGLKTSSWCSIIEELNDIVKGDGVYEYTIRRI